MMPEQDAAIPFMALDIVREVLAFSDNFESFTQKLTELLRELTGARMVMLLEYSEFSGDLTILSINPRRYSKAVEEKRLDRTKELLIAKNDISIMRLVDAPGWCVEFLEKNRFHVNMICPLKTHSKPIGGIIAFGLVDDDNIKFIVEVLDVLLDTVALVLGKAQLIKNQEQIIQLRTKEIEQARDQAEAANQAKRVFLANMSHELRSPLNAILGFSGLMQRQVLTGEQALSSVQKENLDLIYRSGEHLLALINNVLSLSKIEAGQTTLQKNNFDLYRLFDELTDMFALQAEQKGLMFQFERTLTVPRFVRSDEVKLRQVLINLLSNALKFTGKGSVTVRVRLGDEVGEIGVGDIDPLPFKMVHFEVEDTGPGMAPEELKSLFAAFVQTQTGLAAREGTGLGLVISRQFVRLMGGDISVQSEVGRGACFEFDIVVQEVEADETKGEVGGSRVISLSPTYVGRRILVVDDDETNRNLIVKLLKPLGFALGEASNGQEAIDLWRTWRPHLIWMDMRMPVLNGYEATKRIKAIPQGQQTKVLALTAGSFEEEQSMVMAAGCDDFLRKPFRESEMLEMMGQHLGVEYVYVDEVETADTPPTLPNSLIREALAALPPELLTRLEAAAVRADMAEVDELIEEVAGLDTVVSQALARLADQFEYPQIIRLVKDSRGLSFN